MKQEDAEELARLGKDRRLTFAEQERLCDYIISGDMKREIENTALKRAARISSFGFQRGLCAAEIEQDILSLIQPPAQKENGK